MRAFVDYTVSVPTPARATCTAPPPVPAASQRSVTCDVTALCQPADIGTTRSLSVVVFDREPLESGQPSFQAMPPGGLKTSVFYFLKCIPHDT